MVTEVPWGDGSGDKLYLSYSASEGNQTIMVSSDANAGPARTKDITFVSSIGNIARVLTVTQETNMDYVSITWNDTCITFNDTAIAYPYEEEYIVFADPAVEQICATNWGDGVGLKPSQAAKVTYSQFGTTFRSNTDITSFDELEHFTGLTQIPANAFRESSLTSVVIPSSVTTIGNYAFRDCRSLSGILNIPSTVTSVGSDAFRDCRAFSGELNILSSSTVISGYAFYYFGSEGTGFNLTINATCTLDGALFGFAIIKRLVIGENITAIGVGSFRAYNNVQKVMEYVDLPSTLTQIGDAAFYGQPLTTFIVRATTPPTLANAAAVNSGAFTNMYVPYSSDHSILAAYQSANNWSNYASKMHELNPDGTIPT